MSNSEDLQRAVGKLEGEITGVHNEIQGLKREAENQREALLEHSQDTAEQLREINKTLNKARGGWKALVVVGAVVGSVMTLVVNLALKMKGGG